MADDAKMDVDQKKNLDDVSKEAKESEKKINSPTKESKDDVEKEYKDKNKDESESKNKESKEDKSLNSKEKNDEEKSTVNREKVCPFLLRVFCKRGSHHRIEDFTINHQPVEDEVQIYTWKDASLREIASLLEEVDPKYALHGNIISFKSIYLENRRARYSSRDLGTVNIYKPSKTDDVTLEEKGFVIGDFIDVALQSYSDVNRRYSYDRQDSYNNRLGGRFGNSRSGGFSFDKKRKIGERHDRFSSRNDRRGGSFRTDRI